MDISGTIDIVGIGTISLAAGTFWMAHQAKRQIDEGHRPLLIAVKVQKSHAEGFDANQGGHFDQPEVERVSLTLKNAGPGVAVSIGATCTPAYASSCPTSGYTPDKIGALGPGDQVTLEMTPVASSDFGVVAAMKYQVSYGDFRERPFWTYVETDHKWHVQHSLPFPGHPPREHIIPSDEPLWQVFKQIFRWWPGDLRYIAKEIGLRVRWWKR